MYQVREFEPDEVQRVDEGKEEKFAGELVRAFYIRHILHPLFMLQVRFVPLFIDYAYLYIKKLQHEVHGEMMKPDWIEQAREAISEK